MKGKNGQSALEYALLITICLVAFLTVQMYVKRGIQGRWKETIDELGDQYDPTVAVTNIRYSTTGGSVTDIRVTNGVLPNGEEVFFTDRTDVSDTFETKRGATKIDAY